MSASELREGVFKGGRLKASSTKWEKLPLRWNASMVGELVHWDYFTNTMRQLGTVPKVMLENSTNIEPTDCDTGSCSSRQCAIFSFNENDLAPTRHSSIQR